MEAVSPITTPPAVEHKPKGRVKKFLFRGLLALVVGLVLAQLFHTFSGSGEWQLLGEKNGVQVYSMKSPGSSLEKFKGVVRVKSTLSRIVMFMQSESGQDIGFYDPKEIKRQSAQVFWTSWRGVFPEPFKHREFVVKHEFSQDPQTRQVLYQLTSTPDMIPPNECCVRVPGMDNAWRMTPVGNGEIEIEWLVDMDLGGFVPYFIVNQIHPAFIFDFAASLQRRLDDERYRDAKIDWIDDTAP